MRSSLRRCGRQAALAVSASSLLLAAGCSVQPTAVTAVTAATVTPTAGNWGIAASAGAPLLPGLSGAVTLSGSTVLATLHSTAATACTSPATPVALTGSVRSGNVLTLSGPLAGGTLTLTGTVAADGRSLTAASYTVSGGSCALAATAATAQAYTNIAGTYTGQLTDASGQYLTLTANITQATTADANGNFSVTGSATFPQNPCIASPSGITTAQVTGGTFSFTYTDGASGNQVQTTGTFAPDATRLTVSGYTLSGTCTDTGAGVLIKQ